MIVAIGEYEGFTVFSFNHYSHLPRNKLKHSCPSKVSGHYPLFSTSSETEELSVDTWRKQNDIYFSAST